MAALGGGPGRPPGGGGGGQPCDMGAEGTAGEVTLRPTHSVFKE